MRKGFNGTKGFTLVELLLVVTILGILAAIALPRFFPQAEKGRTSEAIGILSAIRQGEEAYFLQRSVYLAITSTSSAGASPTVDASWASLGMNNPNPGTYFNYTVALDAVQGFIATATRNATNVPTGTGGLYQTRTITLNRGGVYGGNHPFKP